MKKTIRQLGIILLLCAPLSAAAQDRDVNRLNREGAIQISATVKRILGDKEPQWRAKKAYASEFGYRQYFESDKHELAVAIYVYNSEEEASKLLAAHARSSSAAGKQTLSGMGDEAFFISHPYFSWVGVRKGRMLVEVRGPGPELTVTKRIAQYGLAQASEK